MKAVRDANLREARGRRRTGDSPYDGSSPGNYACDHRRTATNVAPLLSVLWVLNVGTVVRRDRALQSERCAAESHLLFAGDEITWYDCQGSLRY